MGTCEGIEQQAISDYGNDYLTQLKSNPEYMTAALTQIVSNNCKNHFNYDKIVKDFCSDEANLTVGIGEGTRTCQSLDTSGALSASWCMKKEEQSDRTVRMSTRKDVCNKAGLKNKYDETVGRYCQKFPKDDWCKCYNITTNACRRNMDAAGCNVMKNVEDNKAFFKDGYEILRNNLHCRPRVCNRPDHTYVPPGAMDNCKQSYNFCGKDIDIQTSSNSEIVLDCNAGMEETELPDWWDEEGDDDWWLDEGRQPPFDKFPLNKLPITEFPEEFDWEDDNVRYLTYGTVGSVCLSSCCMVLLMMMSRR